MSSKGAMVPYDQDSSPGPQRPEHRKPKSRPPRAQEDDNVSDVSDAEYEPDTSEEPQFKYSTAELQESSWRNGTCCLIAMCILCIIVAVVVSILMVRIQEDEIGEDDEAATDPPTSVKDPPLPGSDKFKSSRSFVNDRCSQQNFDRDIRTCETVCRGFDCCDPSLPEEESCLFGNREGCLNYARCHVMNLKIEPSPDDLDQICSPERIAEDSSDCELQCLQLSCCWSDELSCVAEDFYACLDYAPCQNLRDDAKVFTADPTIYDFCNAEAAGSVSQSNVCEDACAPAECCWAEGADSCLQSDFFSCLTYEPCQKLELPPAGTNVTAPSEDIGDLCTFRNVNEGGAAECESACSPGNCCVEGAADSCFLEDPLGCLQYDTCKVVN